MLACLAVAALPGPSTALFLHRTVRDGRQAGLAAVAGNEIGVVTWALAAGAGLTALLRATWWLYLALHIVVLVYLGVTAWRSAGRPGEDEQFGANLSLMRLPSGRTPAAAFRASLVTIAANPKSAVFAFSFFPQFLPRHGSVFGTTLAPAPAAGCPAPPSGAASSAPSAPPSSPSASTWLPLPASHLRRFNGSGVLPSLSIRTPQPLN